MHDDGLDIHLEGVRWGHKRKTQSQQQTFLPCGSRDRFGASGWRIEEEGFQLSTRDCRPRQQVLQVARTSATDNCLGGARGGSVTTCSVTFKRLQQKSPLQCHSSISPLYPMAVAWLPDHTCCYLHHPGSFRKFHRHCLPNCTSSSSTSQYCSALFVHWNALQNVKHSPQGWVPWHSKLNFRVWCQHPYGHWLESCLHHF